MKTKVLRHTEFKNESITERVIGILDTAIKRLNGFVPSVKNSTDQINQVARTFSSGKIDDDPRHPFDIAFDQLQKLALENQPVELSSEPDPLTVWARQAYGIHSLNPVETLDHADILIKCTFPICLDASCFGDPVNVYARDNFARERPDLYLPTNTKESFNQVLEQLLGPYPTSSIETPMGDLNKGNSSKPQASSQSTTQNETQNEPDKEAGISITIKSKSTDKKTPAVKTKETDDAKKPETINTSLSLLDKVRDLTKHNPGRPGSVRVWHLIRDKKGKLSAFPEMIEATMEEVMQLRKEAKVDENFTTMRVTDLNC